MEMKVVFSSGGEKNGEKEAARGKRERRHLLAKKNFSDGSWIHTNQFSLKKFRRRAAEGRGGVVLVVVVVVVVVAGVGVVGRQQKKLYRFCAPIRRLICIAIRLRWPSSET